MTVSHDVAAVLSCITVLAYLAPSSSVSKLVGRTLTSLTLIPTSARYCFASAYVAGLKLDVVGMVRVMSPSA